ncbi:hypothetical protein ACFWPH_28360 [Nocardia sp. NPDC058499]|uniref:hypothetical protein n=1 Tax=Nocardia sp. NPDC058499 TaxID=3346530 RepID=UPI00366195D2
MAKTVTVTRDPYGNSVVTARCALGEGHIYVRPNGTALLGGDFTAPLPTTMMGLLRKALARAEKVAPQQPAIPDGATFTARIATDDTIDPDPDLCPGDIVITVDGRPGPPIATYSCHANRITPIGEDPDEVLRRHGWRPYGLDQLDVYLYRVTAVERVQPSPSRAQLYGSERMFDHDPEEYRPETYDRVLTKLDDDPDAPLGALEARAIPQRWFADLNFSIWDTEEPFVNLYEWATGGPKAAWIRTETLIGEAQRMQAEILAPAQRAAWQTWDKGGTPEAAAAVLDALIRYLGQTPTPQSVARWLFANTDLPDYPDSAAQLTDEEARLIALGWAEDGSTLQQWGSNFIDTAITGREVLASQARDLRERQQLNVENWPHEGEPEPALVAMAALIRYLDRLR